MAVKVAMFKTEEVIESQVALKKVGLESFYWLLLECTLEQIRALIMNIADNAQQPTSCRTAPVRQTTTEKEHNKLSVQLELQADCFVGIWENRADRVRNVIEPGEIQKKP